MVLNKYNDTQHNNILHGGANYDTQQTGLYNES